MSVGGVLWALKGGGGWKLFEKRVVGGGGEGSFGEVVKRAHCRVWKGARWEEADACVARSWEKPNDFKEEMTRHNARKGYGESRFCF